MTREWRPLLNGEYPPPGPTKLGEPVERNGQMVCPILVHAPVKRVVDPNPCIHTPARCNGGGYDGCACGPYKKRPFPTNATSPVTVKR